MEYNTLQLKWNRLATELNLEKTLYCDIVYLYTHPKSAYHNLSHISDCLNDCDAAIEFINSATPNAKAIEFSLWFHDSIRDKDGYNEEESAKLAADLLKERNFPYEFIETSSRLIISTKHNKIPELIDEKIITDIDLSIFGKRKSVFEEYEKNIRREYFFVPHKVFAEKRSEILKKFLDRKSIYSTDFFREKYEKQAEKNLKNSIKNLERYLR